MNNTLVETTIGTLLNEGAITIQTGPFGSQLHSYDYEPEGVPVILTESIGRRRLITDGAPRVSPATANRLSRHKLRPGDILFARRGAQATGLSALVEEEHSGWLCGSGAILLRVNDPSIDPTYLSFVLSADATIEWLKQHAVGAVMPNLNETVIRGLRIPLPIFKEQRAIADVLGTMDNKIELNHRVNTTLESLGRAVFRQWFVDFPQPNWETRPFGEIIQFVKGKKPNMTVDEPIAGFLPLILIDTFNTGKSLYANPEKMVLAEHNNVLMVMDGASSGRVEIGYRGIVGSTIALIVSKQNSIGDYFLFYSLKEKESEARDNFTGTSIPHMDKQWLFRQTIYLPNENKMQEFEEFARNIQLKILANLNESRTLASLRDSLLPKLMRSEVRVKDVE